MRRARPGRPGFGPNLAKAAALIGDDARARILLVLLDGREMPASELAFSAGASQQAASGHLRKLLEGGLLEVRAVGRQRLFRLASAEVATAIETLASIAPYEPARSLSQNLAFHRLREARSCYDHLAGRLGVALTERLVAVQTLVLRDGTFHVTAGGDRFFRELGIDVDGIRQHRRSLTRACTDWTERRAHLAGSLGAAFLHRLLAEGWLSRREGDRSLYVTPIGRRALSEAFAIRFSAEGTLIDG